MRLRLPAVGGVIVLAACAVAACGSAESENARSTPSTAAASTTAPTTTTTPVTTYQVKRGDTLTAIAKVFGVSSAAILAANQLGSGDRLAEGQVLQIPPQPPPQLTVTPPDAIAGTAVTFTVASAKSGESITFQIVAPSGRIFAGSPHTASQDGAVTTTYNTSGDDSGTYRVVATGDRGTSLEASYRLLG